MFVFNLSQHFFLWWYWRYMYSREHMLANSPQTSELVFPEAPFLTPVMALSRTSLLLL